MDNIAKKYLFDIRMCIDNIEKYIGTPQVYENYAGNDILQHAVERNLEILVKRSIICSKYTQRFLFPTHAE